MSRESLFAGILIGPGAFGYLALGGIPGAVMPVARAHTVVAGRLARGPWRSFLRAAGCNVRRIVIPGK